MNEDSIIIACPHCTESVIIEKKQIRCGIFRHGVYKTTYKQIHPHLSKKKCEELIRRAEIMGCGKPFRLIQKKKNQSSELVYLTEVCDYI